MAHYAFINSNNIVTEVITGIDEDKTDDLPDGFDSWEAWYADFRGQTCKRTSYNTVNNAHTDSGTAFRGNYAGIGYTYISNVATLGVGSTDIFIGQQPHDSWSVGVGTAQWYPPSNPGDAPALSDSDRAAGKYYQWNESNYQSNPATAWVLITP